MTARPRKQPRSANVNDVKMPLALAAVERVVLDGRYRNFNLAKNYWLPGAALESQSAVSLNAHPGFESIAHSATLNDAFH